MAERLGVRVEGSPARCPWCHGELDRPEALVACAACGARHHDECHREHGRCAACGAAARLVFEGGAPAPATATAPAWPQRDISRPFGWFLVGSSAVLTVLLVLAQREEPRTGLFLFLLLLTAVLGGTGVRLLRWRSPGAPVKPRPLRDERRRAAGVALVLAGLLMTLGALLGQLERPGSLGVLAGVLGISAGVAGAGGLLLRRRDQT